MERKLLALSGGLDSVYVAYDFMKNNPDKRLLMFHVELYHKIENRLYQEKDAVDNILNWFNNNGFKNYDYIGDCIFNYGKMRDIGLKDIQIVAMFKANLLKTQAKDIDSVLLPWHKGEVNRSDIKRGYRIKKMFEACELTRPITLEFPIENMSRKDMIDQMPVELLKFVKSCRKPKGDKPCLICRTCLEYIKEDLEPR